MGHLVALFWGSSWDAHGIWMGWGISTWLTKEDQPLDSREAEGQCPTFWFITICGMHRDDLLYPYQLIAWWFSIVIRINPYQRVHCSLHFLDRMRQMTWTTREKRCPLLSTNIWRSVHLLILFVCPKFFLDCWTCRLADSVRDKPIPTCKFPIFFVDSKHRLQFFATVGLRGTGSQALRMGLAVWRQGCTKTLVISGCFIKHGWKIPLKAGLNRNITYK